MSTIRLWTAWQKLSRKKVAELGSNKEAKKKLLAIADQAIAAIQEAKTQEAVNKALETALEQINKLEAAQPEKPAEPEKPVQPENQLNLRIQFNLRNLASLNNQLNQNNRKLSTIRLWTA